MRRSGFDPFSTKTTLRGAASRFYGSLALSFFHAVVNGSFGSSRFPIVEGVVLDAHLIFVTTHVPAGIECFELVCVRIPPSAQFPFHTLQSTAGVCLSKNLTDSGSVERTYSALLGRRFDPAPSLPRFPTFLITYSH